MLRNIYSTLVFSVIASLATLAYGQSAQIQGRVSDTTGAVIPKAAVRVIDQQTNTERKTRTNSVGEYVVTGLNPSLYKIFVDAAGFTSAASRSITLNVNQNAVLDFSLRVGTSAQTVTVNGSGTALNTTDGTVSTVVDHQFVENIPMNGRSFQSLILLTPGVLTASPQGSDATGEFSVNGNRTNGNSFYMDGASAEHSTTFTGQASSATTLGTTQAIVSVDALQEFRIATSNYSAEFGRAPGAAVSFTSRSGTNQFHGTAFDYLRNYAFDANNWFNTYATVPLPRPEERQNDFGGTFGGPVLIPKLYSGKGKAFFFFNYEGLRLNTPSAATITYVPTNGTNDASEYKDPRWGNLRANAAAALKPILVGFPLPNCTTAQQPQCVDYKDGLLPALYTSSSPSTINTFSIRGDYQLLTNTRAFFRYNRADSTSTSMTFGFNSIDRITNTSTYLLGADSAFHSSMSNTIRLQWAPSYGSSVSNGADVAGSQSITGQSEPNFSTMQGFPATAGGIQEFQLLFANESSTAIRPIIYFTNSTKGQNQYNGVDTFSWVHGNHLFKAGVDYRQTATYNIVPESAPVTLGIYNYFSTATNVISGVENSISDSMSQKVDFLVKSFGTFFQDEWRVTPRLTLSLGLRWDLNPAVYYVGAQPYTYTGSVNDPANIQLSKQGARPYPTTYTNFGPRVGAAWVLHNQPGRETVLRAGGGLFYDTGQRIPNTASLGLGNTVGASNIQFPYPAATIVAPGPNPPAPPYTFNFIMDNHLVPPSSVQYSVALEQAFGPQTLSLSYVGNHGRNLIQYYWFYTRYANPNFTAIEEYVNGPGSDYDALQVKFQRQMAHGLQLLANYTWSHALDYASTEENGIGSGYQTRLQRGNSDHDVRDNFTTALVYNLPSQYSNLLVKQILGHWSANAWFVARTGFPVQPVGTQIYDPATGLEAPTILNWNGKNPYLYKAGIPGGRQFNPAAFSAPSAAEAGTGNAPRNFLRGFGMNEADLAIDRVFPIYEQSNLQFRAEAYNVFNHPNFGALNPTCGNNTAGGTCSNPVFGQATGTLSSAAIGGLSSLYQHGGPRSLEFELKFRF